MITLLILDGFGLRKERYGNAIAAAGTPNLDKLTKKYAHTTLAASENAVGLPLGQMGNSEVGHLTIGAGKVILQDLLKIDRSIEDGSFAQNPALISAFKHAEKSGRLQLMGLLSDGGVHSHIDHLFEILEQAKNYDIKEIYIHCFLDGRDTLPTSGIDFLKELQDKISGTNAKIASICGRIYAMDRESRFDRVKKAYDMLIGKGNSANNLIEAVESSYNKGITDEFVEPVLIEKNGAIKDDDSLIFFNYRSDRAREITAAFTDEKFDKFKTKSFKNLLFSPMTEYSNAFKNLNTLFPPETVENNLAKIISDAGLKQFHISETTKYAHITFFFGGGIETPVVGEERKLIDSIETTDFSYYPEMRANEITEGAMEAIASGKYDFILINLSNPDMIGHTGNFNATKEAIKCVDKCAYAIALATLMAGGECIITADHGNAELMYDTYGNKITSHTTSPVPFILVSNKKKHRLHKGSLANIAPTILKLMDIPIPADMENPLFRR